MSRAYSQDVRDRGWLTRRWRKRFRRALLRRGHRDLYRLGAPCTLLARL